MGAGYHGGFGNTYGKKLSENKESTTNNSDRVNYLSRNELLRKLKGITTESTIVADKIGSKMISLNILGDDLFDFYVTPDRKVVGRHENGKIYIRRSSADLVSSVLHEGIHAMDYFNRIKYDPIKSELKSYRAEHFFQKSSGRKAEFKSDEEIIVHVYKNYGRKK